MKTPFVPRALAILLTLVAGCSTYVPREPGRYEDEHIAFRFPEHWKITLREVGAETTSLILEPPHQGLVFIKGYPDSSAPGLRQFALEFSAAAARQTRGARLRTDSLKEAEGGSLEERFDVGIADTSVPHIRRYYRRAGGDAVYFIVTHIPKDDLASTRSGFVEIARDFEVKAPAAP